MKNTYFQSIEQLKGGQVLELQDIIGELNFTDQGLIPVITQGATSGHYQSLVSMRLDCDGDAVLCLVNQVGAACHTGRDNCFYFEIDRINKSVSVLSSAS